MGHPKTVNHLSLCAGYGGIDLGLRSKIKNIRTVCYVEIEAFAIENLVAKIEAKKLDLAPIYSDLKTFPFGKFRGCVDILSGGFPCQPFSGAGKKAGTEDPRHLFPYILKGIKECEPDIVFLENVEGIISSKLKGNDWNDPEGTPVLLHALRELERVGYKSAAGVFSAAEIGAPHQRKRVFIMALADGIDERGRERVDRQIGGTLEGRRAGISSRRDSQVVVAGSPSVCYPADRGVPQYEWEPPRTVGDSESIDNRDDLHFESEMGRGSNGPLNRLDYALLYESVDNRAEELRLLGNGVVPDTAARAFHILWRDLAHTSSLAER